MVVLVSVNLLMNAIFLGIWSWPRITFQTGPEIALIRLEKERQHIIIDTALVEGLSVLLGFLATLFTAYQIAKVRYSQCH